ncbi:hypothetical protein FRC00_008348, partial [Tulasnella sp. 408]
MERRIRAERFYIPLVSSLQDFVESHSFSPGRGLQLMYGKVLPLMLDKPIPSKAELALLMRLAKQCSDLDDLIQSIISQFNALPRDIPTVKAFVRELRDLMVEHPSLREELGPFITALIKAMIKSLQPDTLRGRGAIMGWLEYCADTDNIDACSEVISQVTQDASSANGTLLTSEFLPLLPTLMSWLSRRGKPYTDQPYPLLFQTVICQWLKTVLGNTKLADVAQNLAIIGNCRCACRSCAQVMRWLRERSNQAAMSLVGIGASNVNHLEKNLRDYASKVASWTVSRTPRHGIEVSKQSRIHRAQNRNTNKAAGLAAMRAISADESVLLSIFGEEVYKVAIQMLEVPYINAKEATSTATQEASLPSEDEQQGDDSESDDEGDDVPIEDPCQDIRAGLENVLKSDLKFEGSFYFNKTYTDAPNPVLRLNTMGRIGLPLNQREAIHIAANSKQAPFGMGERTLVDTNVRDTWEMDATDVSFDNPAWKTFIDRVVQEVCARLGVNIAASRPRCELYKLLLYEKGSHFLPHKDTEKVDGMFATIIVVLPSPFTGGSAHLSHARQKAAIDQSKDSWLHTSVMAWYTDVTHEIKPIQSGYRLALSYNLIHTTTSLRPALSDTSGPIRQIRHILLSWRQNLYDEESPQKIIYLLEHRYSQANCRGSAMKGTDAHVVAVLDSVSRELKFRVGLALVECHLSGSADDMGGGGGGWGRRRGWYNDYDRNEDDLDFVETPEKSMTITEL